MPRPKVKRSSAVVENMLDEASWLLSHAQALTDYGRSEEARAELARAAACEEQLASLLEADAQELDAAIHRVSAASCHEKLGQYGRAVTLLRAALSAELPDEFRARADQQRVRCLAQVHRQLDKTRKRPSRRQPSATS
jgi:tetratricopeptide (TPR) repeat protein